MAISSLSTGTTGYNPTSMQGVDPQAIDDAIGILEQLVGPGGSDQLEAIKQQLDSGQLSPDAALAQLQDLLAQIMGQGLGGPTGSTGTTDPGTDVTGTTGTGGPAGTFNADNYMQAPTPTEGQIHHMALDAAAQELGISPHKLRHMRHHNESIADYAQQRGLDLTKIEGDIKAKLAPQLPGVSDDQLNAIVDRIVNEKRAPAVDPNAETLSATQFTQGQIQP